MKLLKINVIKRAREIYTKYLLRCQRVVYTNRTENYSIALLISIMHQQNPRKIALFIWIAFVKEMPLSAISIGP
jgi:hypothetical protein